MFFVIIRSAFLIIACLFATNYNANSTLDSIRKMQLDSITTNIDRTIIRDFNKTHAYLHNTGKNDEERVWLYYGLIATHFQYDEKRKKEKNPPPYSTEYTMKKKKGVCVDFANLFNDLCTKSNIPSMVVIGKSPIPFWEIAMKYMRFESNKINHAWNIVKINNDWVLMDPTWAGILETKKYYSYDENGVKHCTGRVKIVDRTYYDCPPEDMRKKHKPMHPAMYALEKVPTWKTAFNSIAKCKYSYTDYAYAEKLDSIYNDDKKTLSKYYFESSENYKFSAPFMASVYLYWEMKYCDEKTTASNRHTIEDLSKSIERTEYLANFLKISYSSNKGIQKYFEEIAKEMYVIRKKELENLAFGN